MLEKLRQHFSFTTPASVHDEEALTALELAGRYGKKINEIIDDQNNHRTEVKKEIADQNTRIENHKREQDSTIENALDDFNETIEKELGELPSDVRNAVLNHINNGEFEQAIDKYAGEIINKYGVLDSRITQLMGKLTEGSTTMDAEIVDGRTDYSGQTYPNIGDAFRVVTESIYKRHRNWVVGAYGYNKFNIKPTAKIIEFGLISSSNPYAMFTASGFHRVQGVSLDYSDVWGNRTSGGTFALMYERAVIGGELVLKEIPENFPTEITGDKPIIAIILFKNDGSVVHVTCCDDLKNLLTVDGEKFFTEDEAEPCKYDFHETDKTAMIFSNILCVGDSLTAGHIEDEDGTQYPSNPLQSYPYYLSRLLGLPFGKENGCDFNTESQVITASRSGFAISDLFTDQTDEYALDRWAEIDLTLSMWSGMLVDCIIVGVGVNDYNKTPLGTKDDSSDTSTFYGGYKYLIEIIREYHPTAHIFCLSSPDFELFSPYTTAIKNVVDANDDRVHFIDLSAIGRRSAFQSGLIPASKVGNHYTAVGYQQIARNIVYFISDYINENIDKFKDFRGA